MSRPRLVLQRFPQQGLDQLAEPLGRILRRICGVSGVSPAFGISVFSCTMAPPNGLARQFSRRVREPRTGSLRELGCT